MKSDRIEGAGVSRDRVRAINRAIFAEETRLRERHAWLEHQDLLGLACFLASLLAMAGVVALYLGGITPWWLTIPLMALPISILHELEHDLIHNLYFKRRPWVQHLMFFVIWVSKLNFNPWNRKGLHLHHHRVSGQPDDIEERLIGLGMPFGVFRAFVSIHPLGAVFLLRRIKRDAPQFRVLRTMLASFPTFLIFGLILQAFFTYVRGGWLHPEDPFRVLPAWGWPYARDLMVLWVAPNILRQASLVLMSSYSHYYEDIPRHDVFYQNQILRHPLLWPLQLFCFNFGSTHILHHYVVDQPFYLRQMVAKAGHAELERQGARVNDFGVLQRANRWRLSAG